MAEVKDYTKKLSADAERRFIPTQVECRTVTRNEDGEEREYQQIEGIAIKVNSRTDLGWFDEIVEPGAFDEALADPDLDCRCLFNHNPNYILARKSARHESLELFKTNEGHLAFRYTTPDRQWARDVQDAIITGDVDGCSFSFEIKEQSWQYAEDGSAENDLRKIIKIRALHDVGPVTYPAYKDTEVAKRSYDAAKNENGSQTTDNEERESAQPLQRDLLKPVIDSI